MCTYLNGCLVAFTGQIPAHLAVMPTQTPRPKAGPKSKKVRLIREPVAQTTRFSNGQRFESMVDEKQTLACDMSAPCIGAGEREPVRLPASKARGIRIVSRGHRLLFLPATKQRDHNKVRKDHDHVRYIRAIKAELKRHTTDNGCHDAS